MSRPKREWEPGATYHVMSRGNRRAALFKDDDDAMTFVEGIFKAKERYPFKVHAVCLMTNHFHLAIETENDPLWKIMSRMLHPYSMNFNRKYRYTGHVFEQRYTSCIIEDERYFLEVSRYIHLNPVKAQMVRSPLDYEYSSYGKFVDNEDVPGKSKKTKVTKMIEDLTETARVLDAFRNNPREQYRMFVEGKISHAEQELLIQKDMKKDDMWLPW